MKSHTGAGEDPSKFRPVISATLPPYSGDWLAEPPKPASRSSSVDLSQMLDPMPSSANQYVAPTPMPLNGDAPILSPAPTSFASDRLQERDAKKHKLAQQQ